MLDDQLPQGALGLLRLRAVVRSLAFCGRLKSLGDEPLCNFLRHAAQSVSFYKGLVGCDGALVDFPVVDREMVLSRQQDFRSDVVLNDGPWIANRTNGTIGVSLPVAFDEAASFEAHQYSFARIMMQWPGFLGLFQPGAVAICAVTDAPWRRRSSIPLLALNESILRELVLGRSLVEDRQVVDYLRGLEGSVILYGKPHVLVDLARKAGVPFRAALIISAGEKLYADDKIGLEDFFGCKIADCYTATEAGLIAVGCPYDRGLHVQKDRCLVEVLGGDGKLTCTGTGELVVTNFMNWAQVSIRYRMGDFVTLTEGACDCGYRGQTIADLLARDETRFITKEGRSVSTAFLAELCSSCSIVQSYQFRQRPDGSFRFLWVSRQEDCKELPQAFQIQLSEVLGDVRMFKTQRIAGRGGKFRRFIMEPKQASR